MRIYEGMPKEERNRIIENRCSELGIRPTYDAEGRAGYVPSLEEKELYLENCENPELKSSLSVALTERMGDPLADDSWTEIW